MIFFDILLSIINIQTQIMQSNTHLFHNSIILEESIINLSLAN